MFAGTQWESLGSTDLFPVDLTASVEPSSVITESELESFTSAVFDQF